MGLTYSHQWASQVVLVVKDLPANAGDVEDVGSLDQEDPLSRKGQPRSSIIALKIPWTEEPSRLQSMRPQRVGHN